jgi:hypothetical protein
VTKTTKTLLIIAVFCLIVGAVLNLDLIPIANADWTYSLFPVGAVFLGLSLISKVLEKEQVDTAHDGPGKGQTHAAKP